MLTAEQDQEITDMVNEGISDKKYAFYYMVIAVAAVFAAFWTIDRRLDASIGLYILNVICMIISLRLNHTGSKKLNDAHKLFHEYEDINKVRRS